MRLSRLPSTEHADGGSAIVDVNNTTGLAIGEPISGTDIPPGATIQAISPSVSGVSAITLSAAATVSGSEDLIAGGWIENVEAAVYDPKTGVYTILGPFSAGSYVVPPIATGTYTVSAGFEPGDIPVPADYLGNGSTQPVVFRPSTGQFIEAGGTVIATFSQASTDIPLAAPLSYRTPADPPADPPTTARHRTDRPVLGQRALGLARDWHEHRDRDKHWDWHEYRDEFGQRV